MSLTYSSTPIQWHGNAKVHIQSAVILEKRKESDSEVKDNQIVNMTQSIIINWNEFAIRKCNFILIDIPVHNLLTEYSVHVSTQTCPTQVKYYTLHLPNVF